MKKTLLFIAVVAFVAVGCKNKSTAKTLEGTWKEVKINGVDVPVAAQDQLTFGKCKGGNKAECDLTVTDAGGFSINLTYTITEKATKLTIKDCSGFGCLEINYDLTNVTDNSMTIDWVTYVGDYTKQ